MRESGEVPVSESGGGEDGGVGFRWRQDAGGVVHVRTPDPETAVLVGNLFPDYRCRAPAGSETDLHLEIRKDGRGAYRIRGPSRFLLPTLHAPGSGTLAGAVQASAVRRTPLGGGFTTDEILAGGVTEMLTAVEAALARALLEMADGHVHLHAAAVRVGGAALVALGPGGAGKSSLALAWSTMGLPVLGDDVVPVDVDGRAESFRRFFKVDPERLRAHGIDPASTPAWVEGAGEAWFDPRTVGGRWSEGATNVERMVFLQRTSPEKEGSRSDEPERLVPMDSARALNTLLGSVVSTGRTGRGSVDPLLRLLDGCRAYRLSFASSESTSRDLVALLKGELDSEMDHE